MGFTILRRVVSAFLAVLFCISISACHRSEGGLFKYDLESEPANLDPQSAEDYASLLVIRNIFEGLLTLGDDGKLQEGVATGWSASESGLRYTFTLRQDAKWSDGKTSVTAHDFVFAFQRLFTPSTNAPKASSFFCIKNAEAAYQGKASVKDIGVTAETDYRLVFELAYSNAMFLQLLTTAPAMPCNEAFFESTKGKYGLEAKTKIDKKTVYLTMGNGPFYLSTWSHNNYLSLKKNEYYYGKDTVIPSGVTFSIYNKKEEEASFDETRLTRFQDEETDAIAVTGELFIRIAGKGYQSNAYETTTWGILLNQEHSALSNRNIRAALFYLHDTETYSSVLHADYKAAKALIPHGITLLDQSYRGFAGETLLPEYNADKARTLFNKGLAELGLDKLKDITILVSDSEQENLFGYLSQIWQRELKFYVKVEVLSVSEMEKRLSNRNFQLAFYSLSGAYNSPDSILGQFATGRGNNYAGYSNRNYDAYMSNGLKSFDMVKSAENFKNAERLLVEDGVFLPLYYQQEYFVFREKTSGILYEPQSKLISFARAKK